ncbi:MAG: SWIM zinc finger family protein [Elusimicrobia bacterium]|nr:SWIM zinc finger family protein [Elusimicrobiota bacterium]
MGWGYGWRPYVSVAERRRKAILQMEKMRKKGVEVSPVRIEGRQIARTFWGKAWCEHLEKFSDYENRLPRGRTYVRNGSVCHLDIRKGEVHAKVMGSHLYEVTVKIKTLPGERWKAVKERCGGKVASLLDLLRGRLSERVMEVVTDRDRGLFPLPKEISLDCSCPDWADMCKHVAGVLYGVGARLDEKPELLFLLRGVNHEELVGSAQAGSVIARGKEGGKHKKLAGGNLEEVFGIELAAPSPVPMNGKQHAAASRKVHASKNGRRFKKRIGRHRSSAR